MTEFDQVKDSGERRDFGTGSVRDVRTGKGRYDLLEPYAIKRLAQHFENGAAKYGDNNWKLGQPLSGYLDSGIRHCFNLLAGMTDEDHAAAAAWNLMAFISTKHWVDDGTLPTELDDIDWDDEVYGDTPKWVRERALDRRERELDQRDKMAERAHLETLLPQFEADVIIRDDNQAQPKQTLIDQFASAVATDEPVVVLSGDPASLFQELIEAARYSHPDIVGGYVDNLLAAIDDVDSDKQDSVGSDRPTSTDQTGGNNVR